MLLTIDIGNTTIAFGVFKAKKLISTWKIATQETLAKKAILLKRQKGITAAIISSVVPKATPIVKKEIVKELKVHPLVLGKDVQAPIRNLYRDPSQVGQDRLVNAVAVKELYGYPAIVIDFGTAITFDVISKKGDYIGGIIVPGIETSIEALSQRAALLPEVKLLHPDALVGKDTVQSMRSGIFYGFGALCDGLVLRLKEKYGNQKVIVTGGNAHLLTGFSRVCKDISPNLTLYGLRIIYEKFDNS